jgi:exonuclease III
MNINFLNTVFSLFYVFSLFLSSVKCDTECPNVVLSEDRRENKQSLRLVQYNVEWLFIDYYSAMDCPGDGCTWKTIDDAETHLSYVSKVISELKPDIINLCEVEGCDELNAVKNYLDDSYVPYLKKGTDTSTGQNVGMLTRIDPIIDLYRSEEKIAYPISGTKCGSTSSSGTSGVSKHYITEFDLGVYKVALIGAHLLAIPTDPSRCVQREAQAQVLQNIVYGYIGRGYEIILIGDMNDYDGEILDKNDDKPTSRVLDIMKGLDGQKKGTYELTNIAVTIKQDERFTDWWDSDNNCNTTSQKDYSMIDHILVTDNVYSSIVNAYIYHGYDEYCGKWNSDHYPIVVDFEF